MLFTSFVGDGVATETHRTVTVERTMHPPIMANSPGVSPNIKNTQTGFKSGSITGIRVASNAVTFFMALENKM